MVHITEFSRYYWIVEVHMTEFQAGFKNCALDGKGFTWKVLLYWYWADQISRSRKEGSVLSAARLGRIFWDGRGGGGSVERADGRRALASSSPLLLSPRSSSASLLTSIQCIITTIINHHHTDIIIITIVIIIIIFLIIIIMTSWASSSSSSFSYERWIVFCSWTCIGYQMLGVSD